MAAWGVFSSPSFFLLFSIQDSDRKAAPLSTEARVLWETSQLVFKSHFQDLGELSKKCSGPPTSKQQRLQRSPRQPQPLAGHMWVWASEFWTLADKKIKKIKINGKGTSKGTS